MEEKNVQNKAELNEEQLEQSAGGRPTALGAQAQPASVWSCVCCDRCGEVIYYYNVGLSTREITCECGNVINI